MSSPSIEKHAVLAEKVSGIALARGSRRSFDRLVAGLCCCVLIAALAVPGARAAGDEFSSSSSEAGNMVSAARAWWENHSDAFRESTAGCLRLLDEAEVHRQQAHVYYAQGRDPHTSNSERTRMVARGNAEYAQVTALVRQFTECTRIGAKSPPAPPPPSDSAANEPGLGGEEQQQPQRPMLQGYVSNMDDEIEENPSALARSLQAIDDGLGSIPGLPQALQMGARFTEEQKRELEATYDLTKPHAGLLWIGAALASEPQAIGKFVSAGRATATQLAEQAAKNALANAEKTAAEDLEKALGDAVQDAFPDGPISAWQPAKGTPEAVLQGDMKANVEKRLAAIMRKDKYVNSPPRAANGPVKRAVYWLNAAENQGKDPAALIDAILTQNKITGVEADLTKRVLLDNLTSAKKWGLLTDNANLLRLRAGLSPYSKILGDRIDAIHTLPKSPAASAVNKIWNIRLGPAGPNLSASNAMNATRLQNAEMMHAAGLLPDDEFALLQAMAAN